MNHSPRLRAITRLSSLLAVSGAVLLFCQAAVAAAPQDSKKLIVPGVSIGSVALGMDGEAARAAWGGGGKCKNPGPYENNESPKFQPDDYPGICRFNVRREGGAYFETTPEDGVDVVQIHAWLLRVRERLVGGPGNYTLRRTPVFAYKRPYTKFKTAKDIGLGSTKKEFREAYPKAKRVGDEGGLTTYPFVEYAVKGGGDVTRFEVAGGRVAGIETKLVK